MASWIEKFAQDRCQLENWQGNVLFENMFESMLMEAFLIKTKRNFCLKGRRISDDLKIKIN